MEEKILPIPRRKKYQIIVVDPPWPIKKITHKKRPNQTAMDYSMMTIAQIKDLAIAKLADDACWCFLWTI